MKDWFLVRTATAHHHFREMMGLWSLVLLLTGKSAWVCLPTTSSSPSALGLLNIDDDFFPPIASETTVNSPPHHLPPCFLYFKHTYSCSHSVSPLQREQARRRWVYPDVLVFKYAFDLSEYTNHLWLNTMLSYT